MKLNVSQEAIDALKDVLKEKKAEEKAIRITVAGYS